jgi:hypothetical protein
MPTWLAQLGTVLTFSLSLNLSAEVVKDLNSLPGPSNLLV